MPRKIRRAICLRRNRGTRINVKSPERVILHCSATPDFSDSNEKYDLFGASDIDDWHRQRGFDEIGYHWVIRRTGIIESGRDELELGAHTMGHNTGSIGVCFIGMKDPTEIQVIALLILYSRIRRKYGIDYTNWFGHNEFNARKSCPGISMNVLRELLRVG